MNANPTPAVEPVVRWSRPEGERTEDLLIVLHGYGANEDDLFGLVPHLPEHVTVAAVRAPLPLSLIHISEPTRQCCTSRMPSSA